LEPALDLTVARHRARAVPEQFQSLSRMASHRLVLDLHRLQRPLPKGDRIVRVSIAQPVEINQGAEASKWGESSSLYLLELFWEVRGNPIIIYLCSHFTSIKPY
jgi:hypothetical protein